MEKMPTISDNFKQLKVYTLRAIISVQILRQLNVYTLKAIMRADMRAAKSVQFEGN